MPALTETPELVGFFSYSRDDDRDSEGFLSSLRRRIQNELRGQLGRNEKTLRLFQDDEAIPPGTLWEAQITGAIEQSAFFIPIISPRVIQSEHCGVEFRKFLDREKALTRSDLIFPILYIDVPELHEDRVWRNHPTLKVIGARQYVNWCDFRFEPDDPQVRRAIARLCTNIGAALRRNVKVIEPSSVPIRPTAPPAQPAPIPASTPEPSAPSPPWPEPFTVVDPIQPPVARTKWRVSLRSADDHPAHIGAPSRGHFGRPDFARSLASLLVVTALASTIGGFGLIEYYMNNVGWLNGGFIADYFTQLGAALGNRGFAALRIANFFVFTQLGQLVMGIMLFARGYSKRFRTILFCVSAASLISTLLVLAYGVPRALFLPDGIHPVVYLSTTVTFVVALAVCIWSVWVGRIKAD